MSYNYSCLVHGPRSLRASHHQSLSVVYWGTTTRPPLAAHWSGYHEHILVHLILWDLDIGSGSIHECYNSSLQCDWQALLTTIIRHSNGFAISYQSHQMLKFTSSSLLYFFIRLTLVGVVKTQNLEAPQIHYVYVRMLRMIPRLYYHFTPQYVDLLRIFSCHLEGIMIVEV